MVQIILQSVSAWAQTPTPAPVSPISSILTAQNSKLATELLGALSAIVANPTTAMAGVGVVAVVGGVVWFYFRAKIKAWLDQLASNASNQQRQDIIQQQDQQNQKDNNIDNQNQQDLNNIN